MNVVAPTQMPTKHEQWDRIAVRQTDGHLSVPYLVISELRQQDVTGNTSPFPEQTRISISFNQPCFDKNREIQWLQLLINFPAS